VVASTKYIWFCSIDKEGEFNQLEDYRMIGFEITDEQRQATQVGFSMSFRKLSSNRPVCC
jgi:hypothetical protein